MSITVNVSVNGPAVCVCADGMITEIDKLQPGWPHIDVHGFTYAGSLPDGRSVFLEDGAGLTVAWVFVEWRPDSWDDAQVEQAFADYFAERGRVVIRLQTRNMDRIDPIDGPLNYRDVFAVIKPFAWVVLPAEITASPAR